MLILGADDDPVLLELASEFFEDLGHTFLTCRSQIEAQPLLAQHRFDAALVDYHFEQGNGRHLVRTILTTYPRTKLVVTTGDHAPETEAAVRDLGARHLLYKPFRLKQVLEIVSASSGAVTGPRLTVYGTVETDELGELKQLLLTDPKNTQAKWLLAFGYYRAGKYGDATHLLKMLLAQDPENLLALYYLGACQYRFGVYEDAVQTWSLVVDAEPDGTLGRKAREHVGRALQLIEQGRAK